LPYCRRLAKDVDFADSFSVEIHLEEADVTTFRRNWLGLGRIRSDAGFLVYYGYKSLYYRDERGTFEIGYEDGLLFPTSLCLTNPMRQVPESRLLSLSDCSKPSNGMGNLPKSSVRAHRNRRDVAQFW
jgi:hypothetical protein